MQSSNAQTQRILRTGLALLSVQGITWITSLVGILVLPRFLGPSDFGLLAVSGAVVALMSLLASFGSSLYLVKEAARSPENTRELTLHVIALRVAFWLALSAVLLPCVLMFSSERDVHLVVGAALVAGLATVMLDGFLGAFQANQRLGRVSLVLSVFGLAGQAALVAVVVSGGGVVGASFVGLLGALVNTLIVAVLFFGAFRGAARLSRGTVARILRGGAPYLAWDLGFKVYATLDMLLLPILVGAAAAGGYAFAYRLVMIPVFATTIITMAIFPSLSASAGTDTSWFSQVVNNSARLAFIVTAPMAAGLAVLSGPLVGLLSGGKFDDSAVLIVILALHVPPAAVHTILGSSLFARDMQKRMAAVAWGAAVFNLTANLAAIPIADALWGNGAIGAASVSVATEVLMGAFIWRWAWGSVGLKLVLGFGRTLAATAVMSVVALIACLWGGIFVAIPVGALTYLVAGTLLGVFSLSEMNRVRLQFFSAATPAQSKA